MWHTIYSDGVCVDGIFTSWVGILTLVVSRVVRMSPREHQITCQKGQNQIKIYQNIKIKCHIIKNGKYCQAKRTAGIYSGVQAVVWLCYSYVILPPCGLRVGVTWAERWLDDNMKWLDDNITILVAILSWITEYFLSICGYLEDRYTWE